MLTIPVIKIRKSNKYKRQAKALNLAIILNMIPLVIVGSLCIGDVLSDVFCGRMRISGAWAYAGLIAGLLFGGLLHELAHACACISYGGKVMEIGIILGAKSGAYTKMDYMPIKRRLWRIQTFAAGVEINIELFFLAVILCRFIPCWSSFLMEFAFINADFAMLNILFIEGLDGMAIMEIILGDDYLVDNAIRVMLDIRRGRRLRRCGINGRIRITAAYLIGVTKLFWPIVIGVNIVFLMGVFL